MSIRRSRLRKKTIQLNQSLDKNLRAYTAAASADSGERLDATFGYGLAVTAIGLGVLALPPAAHAKIVYTSAHVVLTDKTWTPLDLNHDGISDFTFAFFNASGSVGSGLNVGPPPSASRNTVVGLVGRFWGSASALRAGVRVGSGKAEPPKLGRTYRMAGQNARCASATCSHFTTTFSGRWANDGKGVKNRYLGFKFMIKGKVHYGWARVTVEPKSAHGILTGYAYETIPNKAIITGKTKGPDDSSVEKSAATLTAPAGRPTSLGLLALGSPGLSTRRREESAANLQ
jgi:hypothetical protein